MGWGRSGRPRLRGGLGARLPTERGRFSQGRRAATASSGTFTSPATAHLLSDTALIPLRVPSPDPSTHRANGATHTHRPELGPQSPHHKLWPPGPVAKPRATATLWEQKGGHAGTPGSGRGGSKQVLVGKEHWVSEGLGILREPGVPHFTPVPPSQPPYPASELQEWKTGAGGGHHWGGWGSQGKGQDPEALVTETRSEPVRLPLSTSDTRSAGPPPHPHPGTRRSRTPGSTSLWVWGRAHHAGHSFTCSKLFIKHPTMSRTLSCMLGIWKDGKNPVLRLRVSRVLACCCRGHRHGQVWAEQGKGKPGQEDSP